MAKSPLQIINAGVKQLGLSNLVGKNGQITGEVKSILSKHGVLDSEESASRFVADMKGKAAAGRRARAGGNGKHTSALGSDFEKDFYGYKNTGTRLYNGTTNKLGGANYSSAVVGSGNRVANANLKAEISGRLGSHMQASSGYRTANKAWNYSDAADVGNYRPSDWTPESVSRLDRANTKIDAIAAFKDETQLAKLDGLQKEAQWKADAKEADRLRREASTPSNSMSKADIMNRESEYRHVFDSGEELHRSNYENYGNRFVEKTSEPAASSKPSAKPAISVEDSSVANTSIPEYKGGAGSEKPSGTGKKAAEEVKAQAESTNPTPTSENKPPESGFNGGAGKDEVDDYVDGLLKTNGLKNDKKYHIQDRHNTYKNYTAEMNNAKTEKEKAGVRKKYGITDGADDKAFFKEQINGDPTTMDWIMGNNVPAYAAGTALLGGAVASCFSNKGKMSNSELYGQNF